MVLPSSRRDSSITNCEQFTELYPFLCREEADYNYLEKFPDSLVTVRNEAFFSKRMNIAHIRRGFHSEDVRLIMMRAVFQSDFD
jgi:hypothetical protein